MVARAIGSMIAAGLVALATVAAPAASVRAPLLEAWYVALFDADRAALARLLAPDAEIRLEDLGIVQTREEFLESLGEWADAAEGGEFAWRIDPLGPVDGEQATALVCYRFASNAVMTRERFTFSGDRILSSVQTTIAEDCGGF